MTQRSHPHDLAAERMLLGGLMRDPTWLADVSAEVVPADFYRPDHRALFTLLLDMYRRDVPIDAAVTVPSEVMATGRPELYGGLAYVVELPDHVLATAGLGRYAQIVARHAQARRAIDVFTTLRERAYTEPDPDLLLQEATRALDAIQSPAGAEHCDLATAIEVTLKEKDEQARKGISPAIATGLAPLDEVLKARRGDLLVLAARPGMGKTALTLNIALNVALGGGVVGVFEMEMSRKQLVDRLLTTYTGIRYEIIQDPGMLTEEDWSTLADAQSDLAGLAFYIDDRRRLTPDQMMSRARQWRLRHDGQLDALFGDYLGLMPTTPGRRAEDTGRNAEGCKNIARALDVPFWLVHQLNREVEKRNDKVPLVSDLKDSGDIEQHADAVVFPHRPYYYDKSKAYREADIYIAKQRSGPTGVARLDWYGEVQAFKEPAPPKAVGSQQGG